MALEHDGLSFEEEVDHFEVEEEMEEGGGGRRREEGLGKMALRELPGFGRWTDGMVMAVAAVCFVLLVYSHLGTSGVVVSNLGSLVKGRRGMLVEDDVDLCKSALDLDAWERAERQIEATLKSLAGCTIGNECTGENSTCTARCIGEELGFSQPCAMCFAQVASCAMQNCALPCMQKDKNKCASCLGNKCMKDFDQCSGLSMEDALASLQQTGPKTDQPISPSQPSPSSSESPDLDVDDVEPLTCGSLKVMYEVQFVDAVRKAARNGATGLAVLMALASGVWPYVKIILILILWRQPLSLRAQNRILSILTRLGKWSFVDVFVMVLFNSTLRIEKRLSKKAVLVVVTYPEWGIYCFCLAATLSLIQSEWLRVMHTSHVLASENRRYETIGAGNGRLRSEWRRSLADNLAKTQMLNDQASLYLRLLMPCICILCILIGFYAVVLVHFELQGTISALPGKNTYSYSGAEVMRAIFGESPCSKRGVLDSFGRMLLFGCFVVGVLGLPIVVCVSTGLLWIAKAGVPLRLCTGRGIKQVLLAHAPRLLMLNELASAFACLDVFIVSLIIVSREIGKVVYAVGWTVGIPSISVDMHSSMGMGVYLLVLASILFWLFQFLVSGDANEIRTPTYAPVRKVSGFMETLDEEDELELDEIA